VIGVFSQGTDVWLSGRWSASFVAMDNRYIRSLIFPSGEISSTEVNASGIYWLYYQTRESNPIVTSGFLYGSVNKHATNLWLPGFIRSIFS
jgi:hypothetical protein